MLKLFNSGVEFEYNLKAPLVCNSRHKFDKKEGIPILMYAGDVVLMSSNKSELHVLIQPINEE